MTSVIPTIESGVSQLNNWLSALASGESASTVANPQSTILSTAGNTLQISASVAGALKTMEPLLANMTGLAGSAGAIAGDYLAALNVKPNADGSLTLSSSTVTSLGADVSGLVNAGLLTAVASAQEAGLTTVTLAFGTISLEAAFVLVAATAAGAIVLGGAGLLGVGVLSSITISKSVFSGLNFSDQSSDIGESAVALSSSTSPDITSVSPDGTIVSQTWESSTDTYTDVTTYTSSARTTISTQVSTDVNPVTGQTTVTTINYNPDGEECTFSQNVTPSLNVSDVTGSVSGTETQSGVIQTADISGTGINATVGDASITLDSSASATITGSGNGITGASNDTLSLAGSSNVLSLSGTGNSISETGNNNSATTALAGNAFTLGGTGNQLQGNGNQVLLAENSISDVEGSANFITALNGSSSTIDGGGNTLSSTSGISGSTFTLEGTGSDSDSVNLAGATDITVLLGDATTAASFVSTDATVTSVNGGGLISGSSGDNLTISGIDVTLNANGGQYDLASNGDTANVSNSSVTVAAGEQADIGGSDNTINLGSDSQATISGAGDNVTASSGDVIDLSNATITLEAGSSVTIDGSNDIIIGAADDTIAVTGNGNSLTAAAGSDATIDGDDNSISSSASGNEFTIAGTGDTANLNFDDVSVQQLSSAVLNGNGNEVNIAGGGTDLTLAGNGFDLNAQNYAGGTFQVSGGSEILNTEGAAITFEGDSGGDVNGYANTVTAAGSNIGVALVGNGNTVNSAVADDGFAVTGGSEVFNTTGDGITFEQGSGGDVNGNGNAVAAAGGDIGVALFGNGDTVDSAIADDGFAVTGGSEVFNTTGDGITFEQGSGGDVNGNSNAVDAAGGDVGVALFGNGDTVQSAIANDGFAVTGTGETFDTTDDGITFEQGSSGVVNGNDNYMGGNSDVSVFSNGSDNNLNGQTIADGTTGDLNDNGSFSDSDDGGYGGGYGGGFYGYYGYYGFAGKQSVIGAALGSNIGTIAEHDLSVGDQTGALAAEKGLDQARDMAATSPGSNDNTAVDSGNKWAAGEVITWSAASDMGSQYDAQIEQAFATWAAASGLTFEQVADTSSADVQIDFSDLDTASSGVAGYTSYKESNGQIAAASIQLENPAQDALVASSDGQLTYSGTDETLQQLLLHEIGHALGLADDADPGSVMYYELTSNNQTLDSTDITGIQSLYGGVTGANQSVASGSSATSEDHKAVAHQLTQLISAMATFNPRGAGTTSLTHEDLHHHHLALAASAS